MPTTYTDLLDIPSETQAAKAPTVTHQEINLMERYPTARTLLEAQLFNDLLSNPKKAWEQLEAAFYASNDKTNFVKNTKESMLRLKPTWEEWKAYLYTVPARTANTIVQIFIPEYWDDLVKILHGSEMWEEFILSILTFAPKEEPNRQNHFDVMNDRILRNVGADFLINLPEDTQLKYLSEAMPGVLDEIETKKFQAEQRSKVMKFALVGGAGIVGLILVSKFMRKRPAARPAPVA